MIFKSASAGRVQWLSSVIPALWWETEAKRITWGQEFETSLVNIARPCFYKTCLKISREWWCTGRHHLNQVITVHIIINKSQRHHGPPAAMYQEVHSLTHVAFLPKYSLNLTMRKYCRNSSWGAVYKITASTVQKYPSWKLKKAWETAP